MKWQLVSRKIVDLIDLYVDCREAEAVLKAVPTDLHRLQMVEASNRLERAIMRLAPHMDGTSDEFGEILREGTKLFNKIREFALESERERQEQ